MQLKKLQKLVEKKLLEHLNSNNETTKKDKQIPQRVKSLQKEVNEKLLTPKE